MNDFLNDLHTHCKELRIESEVLESLSNSFANTGNSVMAIKLGLVSDHLYELQKTLNDSFGSELSRQFNLSQTEVSKTLAAFFKASTQPVVVAVDNGKLPSS
jgi:hypothetical protein